MPRLEFSNERLSPVQLLSQVRGTAQQAKQSFYLGCPITSAGAARPYLHNPELYAEKRRQVHRLNARLARGMASALLHQKTITEDDLLVLPPDLGARLHPDGQPWTEFDYNFFWLIFFAQFSEAEAIEYWEQAQQYREQFSNRDVRARKTAYTQLFASFQQFLASLNGAHSSPHNSTNMTVLQMPDTEYSLGAGLERQVAALLGIPALEIVVNVAQAPKDLEALSEIWKYIFNPIWMLLLRQGYPLSNVPGSEFRLPTVFNPDCVNALVLQSLSKEAVPN